MDKVKMPEDYWRDMLEHTGSNFNHNTLLILRATFFWGCAASQCFLAEMVGRSDEQQAEFLRQWVNEVNASMDNMMDAWAREHGSERDGG